MLGAKEFAKPERTATLIPPRSTPPPMTLNSPLHLNTPPHTPPPYHPPTRKRRWTSPHRSRSPSQPHLNLKPPLIPRNCKSTPTPPNLRALPPRRKRKPDAVKKEDTAAPKLTSLGRLYHGAPPCDQALRKDVAWPRLRTTAWVTLPPSSTIKGLMCSTGLKVLP